MIELSVAFCADPNMEASLHVAASSLLQHLSLECKVTFYFLLTGYSDDKRRHLVNSLAKQGKPFRTVFLSEPEPSLFRGFRPFFNNMTPYYRLALPSLIRKGRLLYLDADTVSYIDVSPLATIDMQGRAAGFVPAGVVSDYPERQFFRSIGLSDRTPAFNSGVILFDLDQWTHQEWTSKVFSFCKMHGENLVAADQTALVGVFAGDFVHLPQYYNVQTFPDQPAASVSRTPGIYHFVGNPKPWDLAGRLIHPSYHVFAEALASTVFVHSGQLFNPARWRRAYRIKAGYYRTLRNKYFR